MSQGHHLETQTMLFEGEVQDILSHLSYLVSFFVDFAEAGMHWYEFKQISVALNASLDYEMNHHKKHN